MNSESQDALYLGQLLRQEKSKIVYIIQLARLSESIKELLQSHSNIFLYGLGKIPKLPVLSIFPYRQLASTAFSQLK
jgi:hypothetical protein